MRLSDFILENLESILQAWEEYARSVETPMPVLDSVDLRNHADYILKHVALRMRTPQNSQHQIDNPQRLGAPQQDDSGAQSHAVARLMEGFTLEQMVSEYLALRSNVLGLWLIQERSEDHQTSDIIRFTEEVDHVLLSSMNAYSRAVDRTRKTVLGVLGHDLRTPLGAVMLGADLMKQTGDLSSRNKKIAMQISESAQNANQMVSELLDLARCNLGTGIPVQPKLIDLISVCKSVIGELSLAHPKAKIVFTDSAELVGQFDPSRMSQVFSNLIGNAVRHGDSRHPVNVTLLADGTSVRFNVQNYGTPISPRQLADLFNPEGRYSRHYRRENGASSGLGLGLFIAAQIVEGHGGSVEVDSTWEKGTIFRVILPLRR